MLFFHMLSRGFELMLAKISGYLNDFLAIRSQGSSLLVKNSVIGSSTDDRSSFH